MILFNSLYLIPIGISTLIVLLIILEIVLFFRKKYTFKLKIEKRLRSFCTNKFTKLDVVKDMPFDYRLDMKTNVYLIKLIPNFKLKELIVYDSDKFMFKNKNGKIKSIDLKDIKEYKEEGNTFNKVVKLLVIYPDCLSMIHYKNQYEIEYIYRDTELYGFNVITANYLFNNEDFE